MPERELTGIFGDQVMRLLREHWRSPQELAEELFAILNTTKPLRFNMPVTFTGTGEDGPLTVLNEDGDVVFNFGDNGVDFGDFPPFDNLPPSETPDDPDEPDSPTSAIFPGQIVSGSGNTYQVAIYAQGVTQPPTATVQVTQLQIDNQWTIPSGTWVIVAGNVVPQQGATTPATVTYSMQHPIWLARPT